LHRGGGRAVRAALGKYVKTKKLMIYLVGYLTYSLEASERKIKTLCTP